MLQLDGYTVDYIEPAGGTTCTSNMQWHSCLEHSIYHILRIYLYIEWWPHKYMCKDTYITMLIVSAMFYHMSKFWYPRYRPNSLLSFWLTNAWHITQFAILFNINDENNTTSTFSTFYVTVWRYVLLWVKITIISANKFFCSTFQINQHKICFIIL